MHAAHENNIGPDKVSAAGALNILIDETDPPALRQIGSDDQQALGRHEGAHTGHEFECVSESAERRRIGRKDANDVAAVLNGKGAAQGNLLYASVDPTRQNSSCVDMSATLSSLTALAGRNMPQPPVKPGPGRAHLGRLVDLQNSLCADRCSKL